MLRALTSYLADIFRLRRRRQVVAIARLPQNFLQV